MGNGNPENPPGSFLPALVLPMMPAPSNTSIDVRSRQMRPNIEVPELTSFKALRGMLTSTSGRLFYRRSAHVKRIPQVRIINTAKQKCKYAPKIGTFTVSLGIGFSLHER
jgi:hypothetical protein